MKKKKVYVIDNTCCQTDKCRKAARNNLHAEHNRMSSQTLQVDKEKNKVHVTDITSFQNDKRYEAVKSNLPPEHKQVHKFTKVSSGEREKQSSCH